MPVFAPAGAGAEPVVVPPGDCRRQSHLLPPSLARLQHLDKLLKVAARVLDWDVVERHPSDSDSPLFFVEKLLLLCSSMGITAVTQVV